MSPFLVPLIFVYLSLSRACTPSSPFIYEYCFYKNGKWLFFSFPIMLKKTQTQKYTLATLSNCKSFVYNTHVLPLKTFSTGWRFYIIFFSSFIYFFIPSIPTFSSNISFSSLNWINKTHPRETFSPFDGNQKIATLIDFLPFTGFLICVVDDVTYFATGQRRNTRNSRWKHFGKVIQINYSDWEKNVGSLT